MNAPTETEVKNFQKRVDDASAALADTAARLHLTPGEAIIAYCTSIAWLAHVGNIPGRNLHDLLEQCIASHTAPAEKEPDA